MDHDLTAVVRGKGRMACDAIGTELCGIILVEHET